MRYRNSDERQQENLREYADMLNDILIEGIESPEIREENGRKIVRRLRICLKKQTSLID